MLTLFQGIRPLRRAAAMRDALSGAVFAAMDIPQVLGYSRIAGMPIETGLYSLLFPLLAFAAFGSSRYLVVAADSATAAILRSGLADMAPAASARYVALAGAVALLTAGFLLLARLLQLGFISDFLAQTVLAGFLTGIGLQVGITVLGQMLGIETQSRKTIVQIYEICRGLPHVHLPTVLVTVTVLAAVLALQHFVPRLPSSMLAVIVATSASAIWNFAGHGISTIGPVTGGLPHLGIPDVHWSDLPPLIPIAASCAVMILTQSSATARIYAAHHQQRLDADQDLVGLSAANAAAAFSGGFVVNGSPPPRLRSLRAPAAKARSRRSLLLQSWRSSCFFSQSRWSISPIASSARWFFSWLSGLSSSAPSKRFARRARRSMPSHFSPPFVSSSPALKRESSSR